MNGDAGKVWTSRAAVALLVAAIINAWAAVTHPLSNAPTANLDTGEVTRAVQAFNKEKTTPQVVLLGSSLVLAPVMQADANLLAKPVERMTHRRSAFLEQQFSNMPGQPRVFCFAIGGEMVSDAFFLVKNVLKGNHRPDAIIFGVAPRDVQDNILPGIQSTESFKMLATPADAVTLIQRTGLSFEQAMDTMLTKVSSLWKYRADLRVYALLRAKKTMCAFMPWVVFDRFGPAGDLKPRRIGQLPEEVKGTPVILPNVAMGHETVEKTKFEYIRRYNPINETLVDQQFRYLDELLAICAERRIKIFVVNMPLSEANLALVPKGFYAYYKARLGTICRTHDTELVDMCSAPYMRNDLFADGVHLDTAVSQNFLESLCRRFQSSQVAASLTKNL